MDNIDKLAEYFREFPGIGERQARRFVYFLLSKNPSYLENLSSGIKNIKKEIRQCEKCFRFFTSPEKCNLCFSPNVETDKILIVEKDSDLEALKRSGNYHGFYFVFGGLVPIVEKTTESRVRINELVERIKKDLTPAPTKVGSDPSPSKVEGQLKEIILAFSASPQGEHTDVYIRRTLSPLTDPANIKISSLGRGLSTGTELEYSDKSTLDNALKNRS